MQFYRNTDIVLDEINKFRQIFGRGCFNHANSYVTGLITSGRGDKNIADMSSYIIDGRDQSSLNRFLTKYEWNENQFNNIRKANYVSEPTNGFLSIDDTIIEKSGKHMDHVGKLYDHVTGRYVYGHNYVFSYYSSSQDNLPLDFETYLKEDQCEDNPDLFYRTKYQIAITLVEKALVTLSNPTILIDSWYTSKGFLRFLNNRGLTWVAPLKSNRVVAFKDKKQNMKELFKLISGEAWQRLPKGVKRNQMKFYISVQVYMKSVGPIQLVFLKRRKNGTKYEVIATNDIKMNPAEVIINYNQRWKIEVFFRDSKQHLGMGDYQMRKHKGVVRHLHLVMHAYTILKNTTSELLKKVFQGTHTVGNRCVAIRKYLRQQLTNRKYGSKRDYG